MCDHRPKNNSSTNHIKMRRSLNKNEQQNNVMDEGDLNEIAIAAKPNGVHIEPRPRIFKLDVDCVQEMFDWLSIRDIHSVAETCTRMQRIAADYFEPNLVLLQLKYDGEFKMPSDECHGNLDGFKELVQKLKMCKSVNDDGYRIIGLHCKSLKQISFDWNVELSATKIEHIKPILSKIESVQFNWNYIEGEFYESLLQFCPHLKHLHFTCNPSLMIGTSNDWLLRSYPTLEHLELCLSPSLEISELATFFQLNPNLQQFSINDQAFLLNAETMLEADIKLEVLTLTGLSDEEAICRCLNELHGKGFYQRLDLGICVQNQQTIDRISSIKGLDMLYLQLDPGALKLNLNPLVHIKQLVLDNLDRSTFPIDLQSTARSLVNLEQLSFNKIKSEVIEPFIQYSARLKVIQIDYLEDSVLNLLALNEKREQLVGAQKVIIYLCGEAYLATKWSSKATDLKMIDVRRVEWYIWTKS